VCVMILNPVTIIPRYLQLSMMIFRFHEAWSLCEELKSAECWQELAVAALRSLDIDFGLFLRHHFIK